MTSVRRRPASTWRPSRVASAGCCRTGSRWRRRPSSSGGRSLQQEVTSCSWTMHLASVTRPSSSPGGRAAGRPHRAHQAGAQGTRGAGRPPALGGGPGRLRRAGPDPVGPTSVGLVAELATQPRGVRPIELMRGLTAAAEGPPTGTSARGGVDTGGPVLDRACRTEQWIERDGLRQEPLERRGVPRDADRATHALERALSSIRREFDVRVNNRATGGGPGRLAGTVRPRPRAGVNGPGPSSASGDPVAPEVPGRGPTGASDSGAPGGGSNPNRRRRGSRGGRGRGRSGPTGPEGRMNRRR